MSWQVRASCHGDLVPTSLARDSGLSLHYHGHHSWYPVPGRHLYSQRFTSQILFTPADPGGKGQQSKTYATKSLSCQSKTYAIVSGEYQLWHSRGSLCSWGSSPTLARHWHCDLGQATLRPLGSFIFFNFILWVVACRAYSSWLSSEWNKVVYVKVFVNWALHTSELLLFTWPRLLVRYRMWNWTRFVKAQHTGWDTSPLVSGGLLSLIQRHSGRRNKTNPSAVLFNLPLILVDVSTSRGTQLYTEHRTLRLAESVSLLDRSK